MDDVVSTFVNYLCEYRSSQSTQMDCVYNDKIYEHVVNALIRAFELYTPETTDDFCDIDDIISDDEDDDDVSNQIVFEGSNVNMSKIDVDLFTLFHSLYKSKACNFQSISALIDSIFIKRTDKHNIFNIESAIGIWISANIHGFSIIPDNRYIRLLCLLWKYVRVSPGTKEPTIHTWNIIDGWREMTKNILAQFITSYGTMLCVGDHKEVIIEIGKIIDLAYGIEFSINTKTSLSGFAQIRMKMSKYVFDDDGNMMIPEDVDIGDMDEDEYKDNLQIEYNKLSSKINIENTYWDPIADVSIGYNSKRDINLFSLMPSKYSMIHVAENQRALLFAYGDVVSVNIITHDGCGKYVITKTKNHPAISETTTCNVELGVNEKNIRRAHEYLTSLYPDPKDLEIIYCFLVSGLLGNIPKKLFLAIGENGNEGKTTFINTILSIFGKHKALSVDALFGYEKGGDGSGHSEHLTDIEKASFIVLNEIPDNKNIKESMMKTMTGGDKNEARGIHKESRDIQIRGCLLCLGNRKPKVNLGFSYAGYNRLVYIIAKSVYVSKSTYRHNAIKVCKKCAYYYNSGDQKIIRCPHQPNDMHIRKFDSENQYLVIRRSFSEDDIKRIKQGLVAIIIDKVKNQYDKYVTNNDLILDSYDNKKQRLELFMNTCGIIKAQLNKANQENYDETMFVLSPDDLHKTLTSNALLEDVKTINEKFNRRHYINTLNSFYGGDDPKNFKRMYREVHISLSKS